MVRGLILKSDGVIGTIDDDSYHLMPIIEIPISNVKFEKKAVSLNSREKDGYRQIISIEKK